MMVIDLEFLQHARTDALCRLARALGVLPEPPKFATSASRITWRIKLINAIRAEEERLAALDAKERLEVQQKKLQEDLPRVRKRRSPR